MLGERRVIDWSCAVSRACSDGVVVVGDMTGSVAADLVVPGGASRSESVRAGLAAVPADARVILVHDAARPMATKALFERVIEAVEQGADAAIPGVFVTDTIKRVASGLVVETVDRSELVAVQTPQAFAADVLRRAHINEPQASDDAAVVESMGGRVSVVPGEQSNIKITVPEDLATLRMRITPQ